jgi:NAD(P)-dependent dehydrogenase (short-subunit alcohol dehydrogenase family)
MSNVAPVAFILGVGSNIGAALISQFQAANYRVATVARSPSKSTTPSSNNLHIQADLSNPSSVSEIFNRLALHGDWAFPSVIVYNPASATPPSPEDPTNPFAVPDADFDRDLNIMVKTPYLVGREAVKGWAAREGRKGTFIMTGNACPKWVSKQSDYKEMPIAHMTTLGMGKSGANYWMGTADDVFKEKGIR